MAIGAITIPSVQGDLPLALEAGKSVVFIGANGAGKTRLGVLIETRFQGQAEVHRIAAHRSLQMNTAVQPPSLDRALKQLRYGYAEGGDSYKHGHRWQNNPAISMLSDFDHLIAALYAEENNVSVKFRQEARTNPATQVATTKLDILREVWQELLPHRNLIVEASDVKTAPAGQINASYNAAEMSDGERVIFYLLGQALLLQPNTILIIDEPELHINKSVLSKLFDKIESRRPDCSIVYITHDVEFAASRHAATKFVVRTYQKSPEQWDIEHVPENTDIPDDVVALIVGSRLPVLFVEGDGGSLDIALYRRVFERFTVIPVGSCDQVIHTVSSFASRKELHRVGCAGIIDSDGRSVQESQYLAQKSVYTLPVSEVENLLLLPAVFKELAMALAFDEAEATQKLNDLRARVISLASSEIDRISLDYTRRRIDAMVKKIGLTATDIQTLQTDFRNATSAIEPQTIFENIRVQLMNAVANGEYETILRHYDNKGLLAEAAKLLGHQKKSLEEFIGRTLRGKSQPALLAALVDLLPTPIPRP
jgi:ABC-type branched-subunit amino acid transport system ATPase component